MKAALAAHVHRHLPEVATVRTTVNADNGPVVGLNGRLGYRIGRRRLLVELPSPPALPR